MVRSCPCCQIAKAVRKGAYKSLHSLGSWLLQTISWQILQHRSVSMVIGEYCVIPLTKFAGLPMNTDSRRGHMGVQKTREVWVIGSDFSFPLRDSWEKANNTLTGLN